MTTLQAAEQFRKAVQLFAASLPEDQALEVATVYDPWSANVQYTKDTYITYGINSVGDPQLYKVNQTHKSQADWPPGAQGTKALYTAIGLNENGYPIWSQPTGAHDAYNKGDVVDYNGTLYESQFDGNTTIPGSDDRYWKAL